MRSYIEIMIDVIDGKDVDKEELRIALLFCRDMLVSTEHQLNLVKNYGDQQKIIPKIQLDILNKSLEEKFIAKKNPLENWWNGDIPKIKNT